MKALLHKLSHLMRWNKWEVEGWVARCGKIMVGVRCLECGKLYDIEPGSSEMRKTFEQEDL